MINQDQFKGNWNQIRGKLKEKWGKLTDDDIMQINGRADQVIGKLQSRYGFERKRAEEELNRFVQGLNFQGEETSSKRGAASGVRSGSAFGSESETETGFGGGSNPRSNQPRGKRQ